MESATAILIGAGLATLGWVYTARRSRNLARKQHTVNVMLQASFNSDFRNSLKVLAPYLKTGAPKPPDFSDEINPEFGAAFRQVANHYEFIAAGLRNGDFDERLVKDSLRGTILTLFEICHDSIWKLRDSRRRQSIYEHLEWLYKRWEKTPPGKCQVFIEWCRGRPFCGERVNHQK